MLILSIKVKVAIRVKNKLKKIENKKNNDESLQVSKKMTTDCTCPKINIIKKKEFKIKYCHHKLL